MGSGWSYAAVPVIGPLIGAGLASCSFDSRIFSASGLTGNNYDDAPESSAECQGTPCGGPIRPALYGYPRGRIGP